MLERLRVLFRSTLYAFRGGFLIRPLLIVLALGTAGAALSSFERSVRLRAVLQGKHLYNGWRSGWL